MKSSFFPQNTLEWTVYVFKNIAFKENKFIEFIPIEHCQYYYKWLIMPTFNLNLKNLNLDSTFEIRQSFEKKIEKKYDDFLCLLLSINKRTLHKEMKKYNIVSNKNYWYFPSKEDAQNFINNVINPLWIAVKLGGKI